MSFPNWNVIYTTYFISEHNKWEEFLSSTMENVTEIKK